MCLWDGTIPWIPGCSDYCGDACDSPLFPLLDKALPFTMRLDWDVDMTQQPEQLLTHTSAKEPWAVCSGKSIVLTYGHLYSSHTGDRQAGNLNQDDLGTPKEGDHMSWLIYIHIIYWLCPFSLSELFCLPKTLKETGDFVSRGRTERRKILYVLWFWQDTRICFVLKQPYSSLGTRGTSQNDCLDSWRENKEAPKLDLSNLLFLVLSNDQVESQRPGWEVRKLLIRKWD